MILFKNNINNHKKKIRYLWGAVSFLCPFIIYFWAQESPVVPYVLFYPVLMNWAMAMIFGLSLIFPPPIIERLARLREPDLNEIGMRYTRTVTKVWFGFLVLNMSLSCATALWGNIALWTLYNGCLSYVFMGLLFAGEWMVRRRVRNRHS